MIDIAKKFIPTKEIVSIYTNRDETDCFSTGFIQEVTEENFLIHHITPHGMYDGYIVKETNRIYRIEQSGQYEQKIFNLYSLRKQRHEVINIVDNNIIGSVLDYARLNELFVTIELCDSGYGDLQGIVLENKNIILIEQYGDQGEKNGKAYINLLDISELRCDTEDEMALRILSTRTQFGVNRHTEISIGNE